MSRSQVLLSNMLVDLGVKGHSLAMEVDQGGGFGWLSGAFASLPSWKGGMNSCCKLMADDCHSLESTYGSGFASVTLQDRAVLGALPNSPYCLSVFDRFPQSETSVRRG